MSNKKILSKNVSDYLVEILVEAGVPDYITNKINKNEKFK
jgi:hypothetical protein